MYSLVINFNMGCIEMLLSELFLTSPALINFNMGCIEILLPCRSVFFVSDKL